MCRKPVYNVGLEQIRDDESGQLHHWLCNQNGFNFMLRKLLIHVVDSCEKGKNLFLKHLFLHVVEDLTLRQMKLHAPVLRFSLFSKNCCLLRYVV